MKPSELGFDLYAMTNPKTQADLIALALECRSEMENVRRHFEVAFSECERSASTTAVI